MTVMGHGTSGLTAVVTFEQIGDLSHGKRTGQAFRPPKVAREVWEETLWQAD